MTQQQLADAIGQHKDTISRFERGQYKPTWETVIDLAKALGVTCEAFSDDIAPSPKKPRGRPKKTDAK